MVSWHSLPGLAGKNSPTLVHSMYTAWKTFYNDMGTNIKSKQNLLDTIQLTTAKYRDSSPMDII